MKAFFGKISFWVISIQFLAAFIGAIPHVPFIRDLENFIPKWDRLNKMSQAVSRLNPEDKLPEKFLGASEPGFNEMLEVIDKNFFGLPNKKAVRGITNRRDEFTSASGEKIIKTIDTWIDFGDGQYLRVASRNVLLEKLKVEKAIYFFTISFVLVVFSLILRYIEFFRSCCKSKT